MSEGLEQLNEIGAQKIYERTHIPMGYIQAILHETFDGINKVQFVGFLSILEREYKVDLGEVKEKGLAHFNSEQKEETEPLFVQEKPSNNKFVFLIILAVIIFLVLLFSFFGSKVNIEETDSGIQEDPIIERVQEQIEENRTLAAAVIQRDEVNETEIEEQEPLEPLFEPTLIITPKKKLWYGTVELDTNKKYQSVTASPIELNASMDMLIVLGHSGVDLEVHGQEFEFTNSKVLKFLYKDGELRQISSEEFKRFNRGREW